MVENEIRGEICHSINRYVNLITNIWETLIKIRNFTMLIDMQNLIIHIWEILLKNKELSYLKYWDINNLYGWVMSQKFPINGFKRVEDLSKFDKGFIKDHNKNIKKDIFWRLKFKI